MSKPLNLYKYKVIFIAEDHAYRDNPADQVKIRNIDKIYREVVVPYRPDILLHELIDPRLQFTHNQFVDAIRKQQRICHYGQTGQELYIDVIGIIDSKADVAGCDDPNEVIGVTDTSIEATLRSNLIREEVMLATIKQFYKLDKKVVFNVGASHVVQDTTLRRFLNSREDVCVVLPDGTLHEELKQDVITGGRFDINTGVSYKDKLREATLNKRLTGKIKMSREEIKISSEGILQKFKEGLKEQKGKLNTIWQDEDKKFGDKIWDTIAEVTGTVAEKTANALIYPANAMVSAVKYAWATKGGRNKKEYPDTHTVTVRIDKKLPIEPPVLLQEVLIAIDYYLEGKNKDPIEVWMRKFLNDTKNADLQPEQIEHYKKQMDNIMELVKEAIEICKNELLHAPDESTDDSYLVTQKCEPYGIHIASGEQNYLLTRDAAEGIYQCEEVDCTYEIRNHYAHCADVLAEEYNKLVKAVLATAKPIKEEKSSNENYDITTIAKSLQENVELTPTISTEESTLGKILTNVKNFITKTIKQSEFLDIGTIKDYVHPNTHSVTIEDDKIHITGIFITHQQLLQYIGNKKKQEALFYSLKVFSKTADVPLFFKFELIALLAQVKDDKYGIDTKALNEIYQELISVQPEKINHDIDRQHLEETFNYKILEHQEIAIQKYLENKYVLGYRGMLLHAGIGTGKTSASLFIMEGLRADVEKVVIICPLPTMEKVWTNTLTSLEVFKQPQQIYVVKDKIPYQDQKYIVCHYEGLELLQPLLKKLPKGKTGVIIDEVHNLTTKKSNRTNLALETVEQLKTDNVLLLSGTPIKSGIAEVIVILKFLDRSLDKTNLEKRFYTLYSSPTAFMGELLQKRYATYTAIINKDVLTLDPVEVVNLEIDLPATTVRKYTLENIKQEMSEFIANRFKEINKNEKQIEERYLKLVDKALNNSNNAVSSKDVEKYRKAVQVIKKTKAGNLFAINEQVSYANQFEKLYIMPYLPNKDKEEFKDIKSLYKYPILKIQGEALGQIVGKARIDCHVELARALNYNAIQKSTNKKVIYFSSYIEVCEAVEDAIKTSGYTPIGIYGDTTKELSDRVTKFTNDKKIDALVTTYQSLSTGTPLTAANVIVCIDMPFRMHTYEQAVGRAWRLGQDSPVTVYILEIDTEEPTINSRNIDIITYFKEEVERITGVSYSTKLDIGTEEFDLLPSVSTEEYEITLEEGVLTVSNEMDPVVLGMIGTVAVAGLMGYLAVKLMPSFVVGIGKGRLKQLDKAGEKSKDLLEKAYKEVEEKLEKSKVEYEFDFLIDKDKKIDLVHPIPKDPRDKAMLIPFDVKLARHIVTRGKKEQLVEIAKDLKKQMQLYMDYLEELTRNITEEKYKTKPYRVPYDPILDKMYTGSMFSFSGKFGQILHEGPLWEAFGKIPAPLWGIAGDLQKEIEAVYFKFLKAREMIYKGLLKRGKKVEKENNKVSKEDIDITPYIDQLKDNVTISTEAPSGKRKVVQDLILKYIDRIVTGGTNTDLYKQLFASMSDRQFDEFMRKLRDKEATLSIIVPNGNSKYKVDIKNNIKLAKELGYDFFQKLHVSADENLPDYITTNKFMVIKAPIRRVSQLLQKKISIPESNKAMDVLTGQVAGDDKAAKLTNPEIQILLGSGLDKSIEELMKIRGGDKGSRDMMERMLTQNGSATQAQINQYATGTVSKNTLKAYLLAMHIANSL